MREKIFIIIAITSFLFLSGPALAADLSDAWINTESAAGASGYDTDQDDINSLVAIIIRTALSLLGVLFLALLIYGGYLWMTDRGNEDQVKRARNLISAAIIGLIIVLSAYAISVFVLENLSSQTLIEAESEQEENGGGGGGGEDVPII